MRTAHSLIVGAVLTGFLFSCSIQRVAFGQDRELLSNAKIIELVRLGLGEDIIVAKINQSECRCDTSSAALGKLQAAHVPKGVIMAMLNNSGRSNEPAPVKPHATAEPRAASIAEQPASATNRALKTIEEPGIYLFENGSMKGIEAAVFSGSGVNPLKSAVTFGIKKMKFKAKVRGMSANLRVTTPTPVFYFVFNPDFKNSGATMAGLWGLATSPNEFLMVQMSVKSNSREAVMGEISGLTGSTNMGARDRDIREFTFEKIKAGVYKVIPKTALTPGEYAFYYAGNITGFGYGGGKIFDFGVN